MNYKVGDKVKIADIFSPPFPSKVGETGTIVNILWPIPIYEVEIDHQQYACYTYEITSIKHTNQTGAVTMDIQEIKEKRIILEQEIRRLLSNFENVTQTSVQDIILYRTLYEGQDITVKKISHVEVKVEL